MPQRIQQLLLDSSREVLENGLERLDCIFKVDRTRKVGREARRVPPVPIP